MTDPTLPSRTRSRLQLLLIVAVFALPLIAAALLNAIGWLPAHTRNFGEIVHPPIALRDIEFVHAADARTHLANPDEKWTLLVRVPADCDAACWDRVVALVNVRTSLGRYAAKLDVMLLDREPPRDVLGKLHGFAFASPTRPLPGRLSAPLRAGPELWLVNPNGVAELRHPPGFAPTELRKDLARLVK